jgi:hypothetical protein
LDRPDGLGPRSLVRGKKWPAYAIKPTERHADDSFEGMDTSFTIDELLGGMPGWDASDLHLTAGTTPAVRVRGEIHPVEDL